MKTKKYIVPMLALMSAMVFQACSDVQYHDTPSMAAASNL